MIGSARIEAQGYFTPSGELALSPPGDAPLSPSLGVLPRNLRRGLSGLTRSVLSAAEGALAGLSPETSVPAVFASRYGEIQTAVELMRRAHADDASSPARFRHSVQNTCLGLLSLARSDLAPNVALSAGDDTLAMALLEGFLTLADGARRVLVALADEPVPEELGENPLAGGGATAWLLTVEPGPGLWLSWPSRDETTGHPPAQPLALALELARRVQAVEPGPVRLSGGAGRGWVGTLAPDVVPEPST